MEDAGWDGERIAGLQRKRLVAQAVLYATSEQIEHFFAIGVRMARVGLAGFEDDAAQGEALDIALRTARQPSQMTPRFIYAVLAASRRR